MDIVKKYGAIDVRIAKDMDEANKYWLARRAGLQQYLVRQRLFLLKT